jgi:hypothetical protein
VAESPPPAAGAPLAAAALGAPPAASPSTDGGTTPGAEPIPSDAGAPQPARVRLAPTAKDLASLDQLQQLFGGIGASGGLGRIDRHVTDPSPVARPPFASEAARAALVARLASAQARQLRRLRKDRAAGLDFTPTASLLATECIDDWVLSRPEARALDAAQLKIGERWYSLVARAFRVVEEWFEGHQSATIGNGDRSALSERLTAAALAQKGLHCWIAKSVAHQPRAVGVCGVQQRAFEEIRSWARHPGEGGFGIYLANGLRLDQEVETEERRRIEKILDHLELEHAPEPSHERPSEHAEPSPRRPDAGERFDSVADAFEAAKEAFGDLLVFTERAEESAERSPFVRPEEVYEVFETMHGIIRDLRAGSLDGIPLDEVFRQCGHRKKPCSKATMKRHHRFYHMEFEGKTVDLSEHVTLGSRNQNTCLSIHWWHDSDGQRFVIGHCGKHLPNTMT